MSRVMVLSVAVEGAAELGVVVAADAKHHVGAGGFIVGFSEGFGRNLGLESS